MALFAPSIDLDGEWWRIFTSGFTHVGALHLAMNMYGLYRIGPLLERRLGSVKFALAYLASMVGGSFGALLLDPLQSAMGASGAIFGLLALLVMLFRNQGISLQRSGLMDVLILNGIISFSGFVSLGGHVGGFIAGLVLGVVYFGPNPGDQPLFGRNSTNADIATVVLGVALFVASLWAASRWMLDLL